MLIMQSLRRERIFMQKTHAAENAGLLSIDAGGTVTVIAKLTICV